MQYTEKDLLALVAEGDEKAFSELFHAHHNKLGAYVLGWTKSMALAEEIVQDVFIKIWINRATLLTVEKFDSYLYIISRNYTFNALRKSNREKIRRDEWARHFENDTDFKPDPYTEDYLPLIEKAVSQLPVQQHKVYVLKRQQGLKYDEIAFQMGISPETARKHLSAALRNITQYVQTNLHVVLLIVSIPLDIK